MITQLEMTDLQFKEWHDLIYIFKSLLLLSEGCIMEELEKKQLS